MYFRQNELTKNVDGVSKNLYTMGDLGTIIIMIIIIMHYYQSLLLSQQWDTLILKESHGAGFFFLSWFFFWASLFMIVIGGCIEKGHISSILVLLCIRIYKSLLYENSHENWDDFIQDSWIEDNHHAMPPIWKIYRNKYYVNYGDVIYGLTFTRSHTK